MITIKSIEKRVSLRDLRKSMNLTQEEFAKLLGKSRSSIAKKESGEVSLQIDELRILREKGINLEDLEI